MRLTLLLLRFFCAFAVAYATGQQVHASHIVGADMTYTCRPGNMYTVRLDVYQDCGTPQQLQIIYEDNPAFLAVFLGNGNTAGAFLPDLYEKKVYAIDSLVIPANFSNECVTNFPNTCLRRTTFVWDFELDPNNVGYRVVYQRCCRNASVTNIRSPFNVGGTYFVDIPPAGTPGGCNNSAVFKNYPPQIICVNNPLTYDNSATDVDGDSLSYELCSAFAGGSETNASPDPPSAPPYDEVPYSAPYSATFPIASFPRIQINPTTGLLSGTPNLVGRFVVTVCCHEWRNGVRINTTKREFQFVVTPCSKAVVADIPQFSTEFNTYVVECKDFTVGFVNDSRGANTGGTTSPWYWDFGVAGTNTDVSTDEEPVFTYPDTGTYTVKLVVNRGSTCPDSIERFVKVYPTLRADFGVAGLLCPDAELTFSDSTFSTYQPIVSYDWNFGDGSSASGPQVAHTYGRTGAFDVTLTSTNAKGCVDTAEQSITISDFKPFAGNDTIIVQGERVQFRARGGETYLWTPGTNLSSSTISNPIGVYPNVGFFDYNVYVRSAAGCEGSDSIRVRVVGQPSIFVPSAFSPNGDGRNDFLRPIAIGFARINYFRVFNRWGEQVFSSSAFGEGVAGEGWDGVLRNEPADSGVYFWVLSLTNRFGEEEMRKGDATLLR